MLTTKLAGLGIAAKAALGVGVAAAAVTTAGATGVLPPPAQHAVASVVDTLTGVQIPDPTVNVDVDVDAGGKVSIPDISGPDVSIPGQDGDEAGDDSATGGHQDNHGACVSEVARDKSTTGREHGQAVSAVAKSDCGKEGSSTSSSSTSTSSTSSSVPTNDTIADDGGQRGHGNGNRGNGPGNSGPGNSGPGNSGRSGRS